MTRAGRIPNIEIVHVTGHRFMRVRLRLFGELKRHLPAGGAIDVPEGTTVERLLDCLGIAHGGEEGQIVVAVNDIEVDHATALREGDTVSIFEPLAGG